MKERKQPVEKILAEVDGFACPLVEVTGGEPLLQDDVYPLMEGLLGSRSHRAARDRRPPQHRPSPERVVTILDVKCPGSGESEKNDWSNLDRLAAARRGEVRRPGSCGLRVRARGDRAARPGAARGGDPSVAGSWRHESAYAFRVGARRQPAGARPAPAAQVHLGSHDPWSLAICDL